MKRTLPFLLALLLAVAPAFAQEPPKREFRGAWLHIVGNQQIKNLSREQIQQWFTATLDALQAQDEESMFEALSDKEKKQLRKILTRIIDKGEEIA